MAGSLIKNLGGGLAPTGGYIVGRKRFSRKGFLSFDCSWSWW